LICENIKLKFKHYKISQRSLYKSMKIFTGDNTGLIRVFQAETQQ